MVPFREPSLAIVGRYILTPEIFKALKTLSPNPRSGHIELTDALDLLVRRQSVYGYIYSGQLLSLAPPRRLLTEQLEVFLQG